MILSHGKYSLFVLASLSGLTLLSCVSYDDRAQVRVERLTEPKGQDVIDANRYTYFEEDDSASNILIDGYQDQSEELEEIESIEKTQTEELMDSQALVEGEEILLTQEAQSEELTGTPAEPALYHTVIKGQTLYSIARLYDGISVEDIVALNGLDQSYVIHEGQSLLIKEAVEAIPAPKRNVIKSSKSDIILSPQESDSKLQKLCSDRHIQDGWFMPVKYKSIKTLIKQGISIEVDESEMYVHSISSGKVIYVEIDENMKENTLIIEHYPRNDSEALLSIYRSLGAITVKEGQQVEACQPIARIIKNETEQQNILLQLKYQNKPISMAKIGFRERAN